MSPAPGETTAPAEVKIKVEHMTASTLGRDRFSARADVKKVQDVWLKRGDEELFKSEAEERIDEKQPNFPELESVINNVTDATRRGELLFKAKLMQEIVEGKAPNTLAGTTLDNIHIQAVAEVIAKMPGMAVAIAKELNVSVAVAKARLADPAILRSSTIGKIIEQRILKDEKFLAVLRKNIGENLEKPEEMVQLDEEITSKNALQISEKARIDAERVLYTNSTHTGSFDVIATMRSSSPTNFNTLVTQEKMFSTADNQLKNSAALQRIGLNSIINSIGDADALQTQIDSQINTISIGSVLNHSARLPDPTRSGGIITDPLGTSGERATINELKIMWDNADKVKVALNNPLFVSNQAAYKGYLEYIGAGGAGGVKDKLDKDQTDNDKLKSEIATKRSSRDRKVNMIAQRVDRMMNKSVKDYYNSVILAQAQSVADHEANQKIDDEKEIKDMKEKREKILEQVMDKYLMRTYFKFSGNDVIGREDDDLKNFVKHDILSTTPGKMSKDLLKRIYSKRNSMPPEHKKEIDQLFKDMGLTAGPPAVTANQIIESMDLEHTENWAAKHVPNVMGYAETGGYYFDRLKLKQPQMEYLKNVYGAEFFGKVIESKKEFANDIAKMYNDGGEYNDFMDNGVLSKKKIKEFLVGKDWTGGVKRLWKLAGILGTAWFLGGGLASPTLVAGSPFRFDLIQGTKNAVIAGQNLGNAALQTGALVSRTAGTVVSRVGSAVAQGTNAIGNPYP